MAANKVQKTKNYRMFARSHDNRPLDIDKHRRLKSSMEKYGFLKSFPLSVTRNDKGGLYLKDGQHRLAVAESLDIPVWWLEETVDYNIAEINCTSKLWMFSDYIRTHAHNGMKDFQELLEFSEQHGIDMTSAASILSGNCGYSNIANSIKDGTYKIKDRTHASLVVSIYKPLLSFSKQVNKKRMMEACIAVSRVPDFSPQRLIDGAKRCQDKLGSFSTREAYLEAFEEIYNFGRKSLFGLKSASLMAMKERSAAPKPTAKASAK